MKKNVLSSALVCLFSALLLTFSACNRIDQPQQQASNTTDISSTIDMGGKLKTYAETANMLSAYKKHALQTGEGYFESETFNKSLINEILNQPDCQAVKVWLGYDATTQQRKLIVVGVDRNGNNIVKNPLLDDKLVATEDGKLQTFAESVNLITAHKAHAAQIGEDYLAYVMFDKNLITTILNQPDCQSMKVYIGFDTKTQRKSLIVLGTDGKGKDIIKNSSNNETVGDDGIHCPFPAICA
jgi:hypothetical protein